MPTETMKKDIENAVIRCVTSLSHRKNNVREYDENDYLNNIELDQPELLMLISQIESECDIYLPEHYYQTHYFRCIDDIVRIVEREISTQEMYKNWR